MRKYWPWLFGTAAYVFFLRPQLLKWGTRLGESQRLLPGDEFVRRPNSQMTHARNVDAPPQAVWPWLAQMGRGATGYYGLDLVRNKGIPSVTYLRRDIAKPEVGMLMDGGFQILGLEPERLLVFGASQMSLWPGVMQDVSFTYLLERRRDGSTRILTRRRSFWYGGTGLLYGLLCEPVYFGFVRQQLGNLKRFVEEMAHLSLG